MSLLLRRGMTAREIHELDWTALIRLALLNGFAPPHELGGFALRRGEVRGDTAALLAVALQDALPDVPAFDAHDEEEETLPARRVRNVMHWWSGDMRTVLEEELIPFFRGGGFSVTELEPLHVDPGELAQCSANAGGSEQADAASENDDGDADEDDDHDYPLDQAEIIT